MCAAVFLRFCSYYEVIWFAVWVSDCCIGGLVVVVGVIVLVVLVLVIW